MRTVLYIFISLLLCGNASGQTPVKFFERSEFTKEDSLTFLKIYGRNKTLIPQFALPTLVALSYFPELKNTRIRFVYKPAHATLTTKPDFPGVFNNRKTRTFTIVVSDTTMWKLEPVLLERMDFNAQVGVIGHELSHAADFSNQNLLHLAGSGIGHIFSSKYIDRFEYRTDSICIAHGLGYQLLAWSEFIRKTMHTQNWRGADNIGHMPMKQERYMNPSTILKQIESSPLYANTIKK